MTTRVQKQLNLPPLDAIVSDAIVAGTFPGACYGIWRAGESWFSAIGRHTYCPESAPVMLDTIWDLASLSKVIGTTSVAMAMVEQGKLVLDDPVVSVVPEFGENGKSAITFRNLLLHNAGLIAFRAYAKTCTTGDEVLKQIYADSLVYATGTKTVYSDLSMIVLFEALKRITGKRDAGMQSIVFEPLLMRKTGFFVRGEENTFGRTVNRTDCAPTSTIEPWRASLREVHGYQAPFESHSTFIQGEVHDPTATLIGGMTGHAGLFSTLPDLMEFGSRIVSGALPFASSETVKMFTTRANPSSTRAHGWDTRSEAASSSGSHFGPRSFGHTGYTGTSIWCDPDAQLVVILLTNRVHPDEQNPKIQAFRPLFHDAAHRATSVLKIKTGQN